MTSEEVFNVIRDLIEVSGMGGNTDPKYPFYIKYFVEVGDEASINYLNHYITIIENHLDDLKEYAGFTNCRSNEGRYIFNSYSVKGAFMEIRDFCKARMNSCPDKFKSQWSDLYDRIHKIVTTLATDMSSRSTFTAHLDGKEYHVDLMVDGITITDNNDIMALLQIACDKYSIHHGAKIRMDWEKVTEDGDIRERNKYAACLNY